MVGHIAHVRWAAHGREMSSFVSAVRNKELYSDCLLCCKDGYQIPAHRAVLAMASPFFNVIFRSYPATGTSPCIVLEGVDRDQIDALLHYIYFGSLTVKCDRLPALSRTAKSLGIKEFPSLEIAPPAPYRSGREGGGPQDNSYSERPQKRASYNRTLPGEPAEDASWSQPKKKRWTDAAAVPLQSHEHIGVPRVPRPPHHNPDRVPVLKQLLSPSYHIYTERSQRVPNDLMPADLPDRAARETIAVCPDKTNKSALTQYKISDEVVKVEDSDELVEVCQLSDDDTPQQQQQQRRSTVDGSTDSPGLRKEDPNVKKNGWASSTPQASMLQWHPNTNILQAELGRPRVSSTAQDSGEGKASPRISSLTVNYSKSGCQSVSPRPIHSPLTPPANRPNSAPVLPSTNSVPSTAYRPTSQGSYDLSLKSSSSHVISMPMPTHNHDSVHTQPLARKLNVEGTNSLKLDSNVTKTVELVRLSTVSDKKLDADLKGETNSVAVIKSSSNTAVGKGKAYENNGFLESKSEDKRGLLKCHQNSYLFDSASANADREAPLSICSEGEKISNNSIVYQRSHESVTSTSTTTSSRLGSRAGPPALLSMVNGTNGWKVQEHSAFSHGPTITEHSPNLKHYPHPYDLQRPSYIPLKSITQRTEKFSVNSENYGSHNSKELKSNPSEVSTSVIPSHSSFRSHKERRGHTKGESSEVKSERDYSDHPHAGSAHSAVLVTDPLLTKISTTKRRRVRGPKSWEYLLRLLRDPSTNPSLIRWENEHEGIFRLVKPDAIALRWGKRTGKHCTDMLSYENFARGLRYHYVTGALTAVSERCFVYKFGPKAEKALKYSDCSENVGSANILPNPSVTEVT